jgi:hypothetical protein
LTAPLPDDLRPGVTVLVRTYNGAGRIEKALDSLCAQTLDPSMYEVLVVPNGPDDGTAELLRTYRDRHPELDLRVVRAHTKGIGTSMNVGLAAARREYLTVVDDDDQVSEQFLTSLFRSARPDTIAHGYLANVDEDTSGHPDFDTYVNRSLASAIGRTVHPREAPASMMFNVAKLVWTPYARAVRARENLRFATDVVYWHELVNTFKMTITVLPPQSHAVYYRLLRTGSHSRPAEQPWALAVEARLDAIAALLPIANDSTQYLHEVAERSVNSQASSIGRYLMEHPDEHHRVVEAIAGRGIDPWVYRPINRGRARDLVTCYAFLPSDNTSALVAGRRVNRRGLCVDVVSHTTEGVHGRDLAANVIVHPFVGYHRQIKGPTRFSQWSGIVQYCGPGMAAIQRWEETRGTYRSVYSRAMWPASHVLAALYKVRHPETTWIAEFSDPLSQDVQGKTRKCGPRRDDDLTRELVQGMQTAGFSLPDDLTLLQWIEHLTYVLADEIVFTNKHQQTVMLDTINDPGLRGRAVERSVVSAHPTLPPEFYDMSDVEYPLEPGKVHLAYFGAFYPTRGLTEVTDAIMLLPPEARDRLRVHVFTKDPDDLRAALKKAGMDDTVVANHYVPYLDFLHLTTLFDCLLVNDARTAATHAVNPYLPSKISDYAGSGRPIWAVVEPGSTLSEREFAHRSQLGDVQGALEVLTRLTARSLTASPA